MVILFGHYPMTIREMRTWAREQDHLSPEQCTIALRKLTPPAHRVTIRRV